MKITGELLKSERTRKNLSVQDVAFALKLSPKIISAIEAGETESLPAKTFIRGFVKSYAQYLKIDVDQVMRQFQEEMGSTQPLPKNITPITQNIDVQSSKSIVDTVAETPRKKKDSRSQKSQSQASQNSEQNNVLNEAKGGRSLIYIGVAVVLVILIVATNKIVDRYQKESVLNPQDISKVQPLTPSEQAAASVTTTTPESTVEANNSTSTGANATSNLTTTPASQPLQSTASTSTPASASNEVEIDDGFEPSNGKPIEIILEAKKDTEILYARGNTKSFSRLKLNAKQVQVIRSTNGLHIKADDGGSFHMVVNGIDKGAAGPNNKPVRLSF